MAIPTSWADAADVFRLTGRTVSDADIDRATGVIELIGGVRLETLTVEGAGPRNLSWLKRAVAYQAAFMVARPDYFEALDVSQMAQDGVSASIKPDGLVLAPLARRCLKKLSWRGTRTAHPTASRTSIAGAPIGRGAGLPDDDLPWRPL